MWSLGCIVAELYCGHALFPAIDENELLEFHWEICGPPPEFMVEECSKARQLFTKDLKPLKSPKSRIKEIKKFSPLELSYVIFKDRAKAMHNLTPDERGMYDFLKRTLTIDLTQRMTCEDGLRHSWFKDVSALSPSRGSTGPGP